MTGFSALCFHCPASSDSNIAACYQMPTGLLSFYLLISSSTDELFSSRQMPLCRLLILTPRWPLSVF